jgi:hypothetical protein
VDAERVVAGAPVGGPADDGPAAGAAGPVVGAAAGRVVVPPVGAAEEAPVVPDVAGAPVDRAGGPEAAGTLPGAIAPEAGLAGPEAPDDVNGWVRGGKAGLLGPIGAARGVDVGGAGIGAVRGGAPGGGGTETVEPTAGGKTVRFAAGGPPFSMRVRSLAELDCDGAVVWSAARVERIRTLDMTPTIAPQPMNGKLRSV